MFIKANLPYKHVAKYYVDTCIWLDFYFNRRGYNGEPLGKYAQEFLKNALAGNYELLYSITVEEELSGQMSAGKVCELFQFYEFFGILKEAILTAESIEEAKLLKKKAQIPLGDAIHFILAKKNQAILVTRDNHFREFKGQCKRPEELI